jgi:hypothetical protein
MSLDWLCWFSFGNDLLSFFLGGNLEGVIGLDSFNESLSAS